MLTLHSYYDRVRLLGLVHQRLRLLVFPLRACGVRRRPTPRSPGSRSKSFHTCQGLRPRRAGRRLAIAPSTVLPSALTSASAPRESSFRGSMAGLCVPLPTLHRHPRGCQRTARGRCGSLLLHRGGLAPPALRRFFRRTVNLDETAPGLDCRQSGSSPRQDHDLTDH